MMIELRGRISKLRTFCRKVDSRDDWNIGTPIQIVLFLGIQGMVGDRMIVGVVLLFFFFQAEDGIRDSSVTGVQTCALPISCGAGFCFGCHLPILLQRPSKQASSLLKSGQAAFAVNAIGGLSRRGSRLAPVLLRRRTRSLRG